MLAAARDEQLPMVLFVFVFVFKPFSWLIKLECRSMADVRLVDFENVEHGW